MEEKLISIEQLLVRYRPFAMRDGENFTKRGLYNWRKTKGFPEPVISSPRLIWKNIRMNPKRKLYENLFSKVTKVS
ncbi:hypothetical protein ABJY70_14585 [Vibrio parahaemolyticus]|uniref:hypothetical protein n=1 Tax=Vibrio parahaemolyticus TaxID=670 RepID=UPI0032AFCD94